MCTCCFVFFVYVCSLEHVPSVRDHTEYVDVLITRFTLSLSLSRGITVIIQIHVHMPVLTVIILIKKLVSSQDQSI